MPEEVLLEKLILFDGHTNQQTTTNKQSEMEQLT